MHISPAASSCSSVPRRWLQQDHAMRPCASNGIPFSAEESPAAVNAVFSILSAFGDARRCLILRGAMLPPLKTQVESTLGKARVLGARQSCSKQTSSLVWHQGWRIGLSSSLFDLKHETLKSARTSSHPSCFPSYELINMLIRCFR